MLSRFARVFRVTGRALGQARLKIRPPVENHNLVTFVDSNPGEVHSAPSVVDPTFDRGDDQGANFENWFSRPIRIQKYIWSEGANLNQAFNPWKDYFGHPEIYAKIKGFSRLRCKLHVKVIINASPFQYSMAVMSYRPLCGDGTETAFSGGEHATYYTPSSTDDYLMSMTQMPHGHLLPQYSKGCEMELPFIYYKDWVTLDNANLNYLRDMGRVTITSYDILRTAAVSAAQPISVSVYAWASELKLAGPSMSLQAKTEAKSGPSDEYSDKPVSHAASAVVQAAKIMETVPIIAPFARATGVVASAIASVARFFGFSNPPIIDPVHSMRINYAANLASTDISTQIEKLSMDPKNELTVDSRTVGLDGTDEMVITEILDRDVYFGRFTWGATDAPDLSLWSTYINPAVCLFRSSGATNLGTGVSIQMTPSCLLSQMFQYWRGDVTLKFVAAASQFHRGRIRLSYDPNGPWGSSELGTARLYQKVWDLSESNTFEFTVPFMAASSFLSTAQGASNGNSSSTRFWEDRATSPGLTYSAGTYNGCLRMDVMNELTAPAVVDVPVFVFINARCVEFAAPCNIDSTSEFTTVVLQSEETVSVADQVTHETIEVVDKTEMSYQVYMGERVCSIRQLMHRATYWDSIKPSFAGATSLAYDTLATAVSSVIVKWIFPRLPLPFFVSAGGSGFGAPANSDGCVNGMPAWNIFTDFNTIGRYGSNSRTSPVTLLTSCYVGWRGSIVWRGFVETPNLAGAGRLHIDELNMERERSTPAVIRPKYVSGVGPFNNPHNVLRGGGVVMATSLTAVTNNNDLYRNINIQYSNIFGRAPTRNIGTARATADHTPIIEAVVPHYSSLRMHAGNPSYYFAAAAGYGTPNVTSYTLLGDQPDNVSVTARYSTNFNEVINLTNAVTAPSIGLYSHAGVDYTAFKFLAVPTLYRYQTTAAGVLPLMAPENND